MLLRNYFFGKIPKWGVPHNSKFRYQKKKTHFRERKNLKISCSGCRCETGVIVRNVIHIDATMTCTISSTPKLLIINTSNVNHI